MWIFLWAFGNYIKPIFLSTLKCYSILAGILAWFLSCPLLWCSRIARWTGLQQSQAQIWLLPSLLLTRPIFSDGRVGAVCWVLRKNVQVYLHKVPTNLYTTFPNVPFQCSQSPTLLGHRRPPPSSTGGTPSPTQQRTRWPGALWFFLCVCENENFSRFTSQPENRLVCSAVSSFLLLFWVTPDILQRKRSPVDKQHKPYVKLFLKVFHVLSGGFIARII
jgi:hypothetical protein